ncbi:hypothetical protein EIN_085120 [Entamoeba invadens IP1]|uniref:hypothetical protein n=1 Tax=Entamoeba invadens IP1 TaxID=370355 RepID=UPI0002C3E454|nr:hypothetical protein EIN_085120 [Entamoeba invadens IP1]ELP85300.1 hypothetical protein EIN_085120 [Entamoeba invadens IP1]|eukprot:XP_004184646.1 hypothetical protein EIN_085120 [Entamoeba invadens IP1]
MRPVSSTQSYPLVARILQRVCSMLNDPKHLIVLLHIQSSNTAKTEKTISDEISMPLGVVSNVTKTLQEQRLIESKTFIEKSTDEKRKKNISYFYINYTNAIETIVFRYAKITTELNENRVSDDTSYICSKCQTRFSEEVAVEYMDFDTHKLVCPNCDIPLDNYVEAASSGAAAKMRNVMEQFKELKTLLEMLKEEYHSTNDYPNYILPYSAEDKTQMQNMNRRHQNAIRQNNYKSGIVSGFVTRILDGPMPWEDEEWENQTHFKREKSAVAKKDDTFDPFENVVFMQSEFMKPDTSFMEKESTVVRDSVHNSPTNITVIKLNKKQRKHTPIRPLSASQA